MNTRSTAILHWPMAWSEPVSNQLANFMIAMMNGGRFDGAQLLREETVNEMLSGKGLCWFRNGDYWGHGGGDPGCVTEIMFNPKPRSASSSSPTPQQTCSRSWHFSKPRLRTRRLSGSVRPALSSAQQPRRCLPLRAAPSGQAGLDVVVIAVVIAMAAGAMHAAVLVIPMPPAVEVGPVGVAVHVPVVMVVAAPGNVNLAVLVIAMPGAIKMRAAWVAVHVPMMMAVAVISVDVNVVGQVQDPALGRGDRTDRRGLGCCCRERQDKSGTHQRNRCCFRHGILHWTYVRSSRSKKVSAPG